MIKELNDVRQYLRNQRAFYECDNENRYAGTVKTLNVMIEKLNTLEQTINSDYVQLPQDFYGKTWHIGDRCNYDDAPACDSIELNTDGEFSLSFGAYFFNTENRRTQTAHHKRYLSDDMTNWATLHAPDFKTEDFHTLLDFVDDVRKLEQMKDGKNAGLD